MAGAVLDACVLYPASLRDTLLRAAQARLYVPRWSRDLLDELLRNLVANGAVTPAAAVRLLTAMRTAFPQASVTDYDDLIPHLINHPKDRHVLAAAIRAQAQTIVTLNLRDFPAAALGPYDIQAQHPDEFLTALLITSPRRMIQIISEQAGDLKNSPKTAEDVLATLRLFAPGFAARALSVLRGASQ